MPNSMTTKKLLADALQELMREKPFSKISISDICGKCDMNRQSFYYHFKDKYDLVNWIFDQAAVEEGLLTATKEEELLRRLSGYLYENRSFYRKAMAIEDYGAFTDHFRDLIYIHIKRIVKDRMQVEEIGEFQLHMFSDIIAVTFRRWIMEMPDMDPNEFLHQLELSKNFILKYSKQEL